MPRGSNPGERRGGRKAGTPNKRTALLREAIAKGGVSPLAFMLAQMRNPKNTLAVRLDAAKSAAPYVHPIRLASVEQSGPDGGPMEQVTRIERIIFDPRSIEGPAVRQLSGTSTHPQRG